MKPRISKQGAASARQAGLTLIEVLVAIVVLAVGLLGVAGLQLTALKNGQQSYTRSQASSLAYEIADRMRANRIQAGLGAYVVNGTPTATPATPTSGVNCSSAACTPAQLAQADVAAWYTNLQNALPGGAGRIYCGTPGSVSATCAAGQLQTVEVIWDEQRSGATNADCSTVDATHLTCFRVSFAP